MKRGKGLQRRAPMPRTGFNRAEATQPTTSKERRFQRRLTARRANDFSNAAKAAIDGRSGGWCEWPGCPHRATDRAHRENRNPRNGHASNALHLCRSHHEWTHAHRPEANELGARVSDGHDYRAIPVLTRHSPRKVLLLDDGSWIEATEAAA